MKKARRFILIESQSVSMKPIVPVAEESGLPISTQAGVWRKYKELIQEIANGRVSSPRDQLEDIYQESENPRLRALIQNDLGVFDANSGLTEMARKRFYTALFIDPACEAARTNLHTLGSSLPEPRRAETSSVINQERRHSDDPPRPLSESNNRGMRRRVAIISLLFNWPSTGGGIVHTYETIKFLSKAGYDVKHFYARNAEWQLGNVAESAAPASEALSFRASEWSVEGIRGRFRTAVNCYNPDCVIVTDSWNSKPLLAEAVRDYRFFLRIAAQECLCPLNNVRLLFENENIVTCPRHQLATPEVCCSCVYQRGSLSSPLHRAERELVGYGSMDYDRSLRWAFANAEAVLVVNPLVAAMVSPYSRRVHVVPSGFDSSRFSPTSDSSQRIEAKVRFLFAGLVDELMKGFHILREACKRLWRDRQDFELLVTANPSGSVDPFAKYIGWQSQSELPRVLNEVDVLVFPTIAEEALGRTAVEAMGAGRPVVASRIGGLMFTVVDEATGLLFEPGDVEDLCRKLRRLMDDPDLRMRMGAQGRRRFEEHYTWEAIIERHYRPLLGAPVFS